MSRGGSLQCGKNAFEQQVFSIGVKPLADGPFVLPQQGPLQ